MKECKVMVACLVIPGSRGIGSLITLVNEPHFSAKQVLGAALNGA